MVIAETDLITTLKDQTTPVDPTDTMAEAGRKILLADFVKMLKHEDGSRTGEDIEDVHQMRVATRRMRSAIRLLHDYYKDKTIRPYEAYLRVLARSLGAIRDLDVLIERLEAYSADLPAYERTLWENIIAKLDKRRAKARKNLITLLDSDDYQKFVKRYTKFLLKPGKGAKSINDETTPHQVRHVLPVVIHEHLSTICAYETLLDRDETTADDLHQLRIEFKRLRYILSYFEDVLGKSIEDFIDQMKAMQDYLGNLNDLVTAQSVLRKLKLDDDQDELVEGYLNHLREAQAQQQHDFNDVWDKFNKRAVQSKLTNALLILR